MIEEGARLYIKALVNEEVLMMQATGISNRQRIANQRIALNQESAAAKEKVCLASHRGFVPNSVTKIFADVPMI